MQYAGSMSRVCEITGKRPLVGNTVSHSNVKKKTRQLPNLRKKRFFDEESGQWVTLKVSASGIRTINKVGLKKALEMDTNPNAGRRTKRKPKKASERRKNMRNGSRNPKHAKVTLRK